MSCHAKILTKLCLVVLIIPDMQARTPNASLVLQISLTQYSLPDSSDNCQLDITCGHWSPFRESIGRPVMEMVRRASHRVRELKNTRPCGRKLYPHPAKLSERHLRHSICTVPERSARTTENFGKDSRSTGRYLNP